MSQQNPEESTRMKSNFTRRNFIKAGLSVATAPLIAGCTEGSSSSDSGTQNVEVGVTTPYPPFTYREDGDFVGIDIDILGMIFENAEGMSASFNEITWSTFLEDLNADRFDVVGTSLSQTPEREEEMLFSDPHMISWKTVATMEFTDIETLEDVRGKTVAVATGSLSQSIAEDVLTPLLDGEITIDTYDGMTNILSAIEAGQADATVSDDVVLRRFQIEYDNIVLVEGSASPEEGWDDPPEHVGLDPGKMSYGFRQGDTELQTTVNEGLAELKESGEYSDMVSSHIAGEV